METLPVEPVKVNLAALGEQVKQCRRKLGIKQDTLAEAVGITPQHLSNIENGKGNASLKVVANLSLQLKIGMTELMSGTVPPPEPLPEDIPESRDELLMILCNRLKNATESDLLFYIGCLELDKKRNCRRYP